MVARGGAWLPGGVHGCKGGMHGCWGVCMVVGGCVVVGGVHGCGGCACVVAGRHAWLWGGMHRI